VTIEVWFADSIASLRVLSQNLFVHYFVFNSNDKTERLAAFVDKLPTLAQPPDVVLMQEVFEVKVGPMTIVEPAIELLRHAKTLGYGGSARGTAASFGQNNGLLMFSKHVMSSVQAYTFNNRAEHICAKGILHAVVQLRDSATGAALGRPIHFLTAHLDSRGPEMKRRQLMELRAHYPPLFEPDNRTPTSIVVAGDLNVNALQGEFYQMLCSILCPSGELIDAHTPHYVAPDDITCEEDKACLDYLFVSPHLAALDGSGLSFTIERIYGGANNKEVSDHWGVSCSIAVPPISDSLRSLIDSTPRDRPHDDTRGTIDDMPDPASSSSSAAAGAGAGAGAGAASPSEAIDIAPALGPISLRASQDGLVGSPSFDASPAHNAPSGIATSSEYGMSFSSLNPKYWSDFIFSRDRSALLGWQTRTLYSRLEFNDQFEFAASAAKPTAAILQLSQRQLLVLRAKGAHMLTSFDERSFQHETRELAKWSTMRSAVLLDDNHTAIVAHRSIFRLDAETFESSDISSHAFSSLLHPPRLLLAGPHGQVWAISNRLNLLNLSTGKLNATKHKGGVPWSDITAAVFFPPGSSNLVATSAGGCIYQLDVTNDAAVPLVWTVGSAVTLTNLLVVPAASPDAHPHLFGFSTNWLYEILIEGAKLVLDEVCFAAWGTVTASCLDRYYYERYQRHRIFVASDICFTSLILPLAF